MHLKAKMLSTINITCTDNADSNRISHEKKAAVKKKVHIIRT